MELADERRRLLNEIIGPDGVIYGKLGGLVFPRWGVRQHPAEIYYCNMHGLDARSQLDMIRLQMKRIQQ